MEERPPSYSGGRLTRLELTPSSEDQRRNTNSSPLHRVTSGRIDKSHPTRKAARKSASPSSNASSPPSKKARARQLDEVAEDRALDSEVDEVGPYGGGTEGEGSGQPKRRSEKAVTDASNSQASEGGMLDEADALPDEMGEDQDLEDEAAYENYEDSENHEEYEDYDGGSDSDWDDFPRVRRRMGKYLIDKYSTEGSAQWTPFQAKLHKLCALAEGYPVMLNHWKFPYFAEWAIPLSDQFNSPLAPRGLNKRVALKAHGDFFRALKALKRLFNLSATVAGYRQLDDMEHRIAGTLVDELEAYWQWAMKDAGVDQKLYFRNTFMIRLRLGDTNNVVKDAGTTDSSMLDPHEPAATSNWDEHQQSARADIAFDGDHGNKPQSHEGMVQDNEEGQIQIRTPSQIPPIQLSAIRSTVKNETAADISTTLVGSPDPPQSAPKQKAQLRAPNSISISSPAKSLTDVKSAGSDGPAGRTSRSHLDQTSEGRPPTAEEDDAESVEEDVAAEDEDPIQVGEQEGARLLDDAIHTMRIREYGNTFRQYIEDKTGTYLASLDFVLFVIIQHRIMVCTLDVSKPESQPVVVTTFNMADTRQWLWNTLKLAVPMHLARDEILEFMDLWDNKPVRNTSGDPDL